MANKYHHQTCGKDFEARAPYNFVPLPEAVLSAPDPIPDQDRYHGDRYTGHFVLNITTETPLYVRCAYPPAVPVGEDGKREIVKTPECQDFFHHGDPQIPAIPGSTLRGMTRALVEILSFSKIPFPNAEAVLNKELFHRGVGDMSSMGDRYRRQMLGENKASKGKEFEYPQKDLRGGYLEIMDGEYFIRPSLQDKFGETFVHVEESEVKSVLSAQSKKFELHTVYSGLWVEPVPRTKPPRSRPSLRLNLAYTKISATQVSGNWKEVNLVASGQMDSKHMHCAIYRPDNDDSKLIKISPRSWALYQEDLEIQRSDENTPRPLKKGEPLFYLLNKRNELVFFGSTMMFRMPYPSRLADFIPEHTRSETETDLAEAIFGIVDNEKILAGRVFFADAEWLGSGEDPFLGKTAKGRLIPKILSSPKPTSFQLYLNQPEVEAVTKWNSKKRQDQTVQDGSTLKSYYDAGETVIRGFKSYWHHKSLERSPFTFQDGKARVIGEGKGLEIFKADPDGPDEFEGERGHWAAPKTPQHTVIRPVRKGVMFRSKLYFENLSKVELGALLIALNLPKSKRHKIGMAKPLGLGTVRIEPQLTIEERSPGEDKQARYDKLFVDEQQWQRGNMSPQDAIRIAKECVNCFRQTIVSHYNGSVKETSRVAESANPDQIPRLEALYTLLEWDNGIGDERKIEYLGLEMKWQQAEWRNRHVLPYPQVVAGGQPLSPVELANGSADSPTTIASQLGAKGRDKSTLKKAEPVKPKITEDKEIVTLETEMRDGKVQARTKDEKTVPGRFKNPQLRVEIGAKYRATVKRQDGEPIGVVILSLL